VVHAEVRPVCPEFLGSNSQLDRLQESVLG